MKKEPLGFSEWEVLFKSQTELIKALAVVNSAMQNMDDIPGNVFAVLRELRSVARDFQIEYELSMNKEEN